MNELVEIYTKSKAFDNADEIKKEIERIRTQVTDFMFEELARYVCDEPNGKKILVELQVLRIWRFRRETKRN